MGNNAKLTLLTILILGVAAWAYTTTRKQVTGGSANNGMTAEFRGPGGGWGGRRGGRPERPRISDDRRAAMRAARESGDFEKMREIMQSSIPEERLAEMQERRQARMQAMQERTQKTQAMLGQKDFERFMQKRRQQGRRGRGGFGRGPGGRGGRRGGPGGGGRGGGGGPR